MLSKLLPLSFGALALSACTTTDDPVLVRPDLGTARTRIINSIPSTDDQDSTVMMIHAFKTQDGKDGGNLCTAVAIAPKLVLTARHCVSNTDEVVGCNSDGTPLEGALISSDFDAKDIYFFTGKTRAEFTHLVPTNIDLTKWKPASRGVQVIHDGSGTLCNHDLALVVLDTPLNVPIASIRLDRDPVVGEATVSVGWGITLAELEPAVRQQRRDIPVKRLGPNDSYPVLTRAEFLTGESICLGDSGGPIFAQKTNAVIGVVSRGGNGSDYNPTTPGSTCTEADNFNTKLSPFKEIINQGFAAAGASPKLEPPPEDDDCHVSAVGRSGRAELGIFGLLLGLSAIVRRRRK
jgi:hypothetical protein